MSYSKEKRNHETSNFNELFKKKFSLSHVNHIAQVCGFSKRSTKKASALDFLKAFCFITVFAHSSYSTFAAFISMLIGQTISKQAIQKRTNDSFVLMLKELLKSLLTSTVKKDDQTHLFTEFNRILIQDSTTLSLPSSAAKHFPGSRNQSDKTFAQVKIQTVIDIKNNMYQQFNITPFTYNDQAASSDIIPMLEPNDLLLRDLGYFAIKAIKRIEEKNAFFCSRLRFGVSIFDCTYKKELDLLRMLKEKNTLDLEVLIGAEEKMPVRLVAIPVPQEIAAQRRRKLATNRDRRSKPTPAQRALCNWVIFITNIPRTVCSKKQIQKIYALRWRIEIIFKTWKSHYQFKEFSPNASKSQIEAYIYARLLVITLYQQCDDISFLNCPVSIQKVAKFNADFFWIIFGCKNVTISERFHKALVSYFCSYEKRKKRNNYIEMINNI